MAWLEVLHAVATMLWVAGLTAVALLDRRRPGAHPRALYRRAVAPAAFVALLTGIGLLHHDPRLLRSGVMMGKLAGVAALGLVDFGCQRGFGQQRPWLPAVAVALGAAIGALSLATPEAA